MNSFKRWLIWWQPFLYTHRQRQTQRRIWRFTADDPRDWPHWTPITKHKLYCLKLLYLPFDEQSCWYSVAFRQAFAAQRSSFQSSGTKDNLDLTIMAKHFLCTLVYFKRVFFLNFSREIAIVFCLIERSIFLEENSCVFFVRNTVFWVL